MSNNFELYLTISIFCAAITVGLAMVLQERRPKTDLAPSLIPTTPVLYTSVFVGVLAGVHLLNLVGVQTGR
jgi:hypothetical protein